MNGFFLLIPFFLIRFALLFFFIIITRRPPFSIRGGACILNIREEAFYGNPA